MKRSFFPILFAAVVLLTASCIKNTESDGVKAVRMGQAALLTAQATSTTTLATANATLLTAQAAVQTAMATVNTARAKYLDAMSAQQAANTARILENTRHVNALSVIEEGIRTAQSLAEKAMAANALLEENARSAAALVALADDKVNNDSELALDKIKADINLAAKQLALAKAKLDNATALAESTNANDLALVQLKADKLGTLATGYNIANLAYMGTLADIQNLNNNITINKNQQLAYTSSPYLYNKDVLVAGPVLLKDSGAVKAARDAQAKAITDLPGLVTTQASRQASDDAAKTVVTYWTNLKNATGTTASAMALDAIAKRDAEATVYAQLNVNWKAKLQEIQNPDFNGTYGTRTLANNAAAAAATALLAKMALLTPDVKADSAAAENAFKININPLGGPATWVNEALGNGLYAWVVDPAFPAKPTTTYANAVSFQNALYTPPAGGWPAGSPGAVALANAQSTLTWAQAKYDAALTKIAKIRADISTASAAKVGADAAAKVFNDQQTALTDQLNALAALKIASSEREAWYQNLIVWIQGDPNTIPPTLSYANDLAFINSQLLSALAVRWGTGATLLTTGTVTGTTDGSAYRLQAAKDNVTNKNTFIAVTGPANIVAAVLAYRQQLPLNATYYAYLQTQIDAWTLQIANLNVLLGIQKAAVTMWLDKIKLALQ